MKIGLPKPLKSLLNRISARSRIAIGLAFLQGGILMLAITLRIVPNERQAAIEGRAEFCEAVAVHCSTCVAGGAEKALRTSFEPMLVRNKDVLSAAIVRSDGKRVAVYGSHPVDWAEGGGATEDTHILVPIWENKKRWGTVQVRFRPLGYSGFWANFITPQTQLVAFVTCSCAALFMLYLRKMLQHLDPSKVVPPRVRSALDTLAEGLIVLDNEQRIMLANQAFATLAGRTAEELLGSSISRLPWFTAPAARGKQGAPSPAADEYPWQLVCQDGQPRRGGVMRLHDPSGMLRTFSVNCSPILGDSEKGRVLARGVLVSFDDVTALEQKEQEVRKSRDAAEHANQAKSEFLARMSHEIRTPMNAILGFADILRRGYESNEGERKEYLETIHSSGQHLLELINDVLDLSKIEAGKLEIELGRCSPHKLISEVVTILAVRGRQKGISLEFGWDSLVPETIETDSTRLRQVITNLIGNAIKFTDAGSVRIRARLMPDGPAPTMAIQIIDTGIGMKPEVLGRIFTPFSQADNSITRRFGGTGLGLSISKQIAEALGGGIRVESEYGRGSTFTAVVRIGSLVGVQLLNPMDVQRAGAVLADAPAAPDLRLPPCRVLVVDDGAPNRKLIKLVLHRAGVTVVDQAGDGQTGVQLALAGDYDIVLMDMQMPVMDGYTAASYLRGKGYKKPIIALTAHAMRGDEEKCRAAGCSGFLTKPVDMDLLVRTVSNALGTGGGGAVSSSLKSTQDAPSAPVGADSTPLATVQDPLQRVYLPVGVAHVHDPLRSSLPTEDPEFAEIVDEFVSRLQDQVGAIHQAWDHGALDELTRLAHWIKGSGGTAGFDALTSPARDLESAAQCQKLEAIALAITSLQATCDRITAGNPRTGTIPTRTEAIAR